MSTLFLVTYFIFLPENFFYKYAEEKCGYELRYYNNLNQTT